MSATDATPGLNSLRVLRHAVHEASAAMHGAANILLQLTPPDPVHRFIAIGLMNEANDLTERLSKQMGKDEDDG